jgi:alanyl-tRNA synthetase
MSTSAVNSLSSSSLEQILASALQSAEKTINKSATTSSASAQSDSSQLSPFAQLAATLQQLQQSDPTEYKQVTEQVSKNLTAAAQTQQADGNSTAANQLNQLASDFSTASQTGQLPNLQDLAQAVGGSGGGHHHHHRTESSDSSSSSSSSSTDASTSTSDSQTTQSSQAASLNPFAIISQTLTAAGIGSSDNQS